MHQETILKSDEKYSRLLELSPIAIVYVNDKLIIKSVNSKFLEMFGFTKNEIMNRSPIMTLSERSIRRYKEFTSDNEDKVIDEAVWCKKKNGIEFPCIINAKKIFNQNRKFVGIIAMIEDITKLYEAQKIIEDGKIKIQESENIYRGLFELNPDPIRISTLDLITITVNQSFLNKFGYSKKEIVGKPIFETIDNNSRKTINKTLKDLKKGKRVENIETVYHKKDGTKIPVLLSLSLSRDQKNKPTGYIAVIKDASEIYEARKKIKESEEKILNQYFKLKQVDELKDEFASMISHELTTPLFPIKFHAEMLKDPQIFGRLNDEQINSVNEIYENAIRLDKLISDILDVHKLERKGLKFIKTDFVIDVFMNKIENINRAMMNDKSIKFTNSTKDKITMNSDPGRLEQVFANLIKNSVDFSPEKNGKIEINAKTGSNNLMKFYVKDNGAGIPKGKQENLFKKFYQIDTSVRRKHGGSGLGLSICKGIVNGLGGKIWLESTENIGTVVHFTIPIGDTT